MRAYEHAKGNSIIPEIPCYNRRGAPRPPAIIEFVSESDIFSLSAGLYSKSTLKSLLLAPFPSLRSSLEGGCSPHSCPPAFRGGLHSSNRSDGLFRGGAVAPALYSPSERLLDHNPRLICCGAPPWYSKLETTLSI